MISLFAQALAYVLHKTPYVFPIVGGRKVEHLKGNIEALSLELSDAELDEIDKAVPFDVGFPLNFLFGENYKVRMTAKDMWLIATAAHLDVPDHERVSLFMNNYEDESNANEYLAYQTTQ
jgi:hypothetical protein